MSGIFEPFDGNAASPWGDGLAKQIWDNRSSLLFDARAGNHYHVSLIARRALLLVIFDDRTSPGGVELQVEKSRSELDETMPQKSTFPELTVADIQDLFD